MRAVELASILPTMKRVETSSHPYVFPSLQDVIRGPSRRTWCGAAAILVFIRSIGTASFCSCAAR